MTIRKLVALELALLTAGTVIADPHAWSRRLVPMVASDPPAAYWVHLRVGLLRRCMSLWLGLRPII